MTWAKLSVKEWQRRPVRTAITAAGVAIAVATLFSLLAFQRGYRNGVQRELDRLGAHVLVVPKGCPYDAASIALHGASWPCYLKEAYLAEVRSTPGVASAAPALMSASYDSSGQQTVLVGIDRNMLDLKKGWHVRGRFPEESGDVLIGQDVAQRRQWRTGQQVTISGLAGHVSRVSGILEGTGEADDTFIFLRLSDAQRELQRPGELTHILVRLQDPNDLDRIVDQLRGCDAGLYMNVVPLAHLFRTIQGVVNSTRWLLAGIALVGLLTAGAGVSNSLLLAVAERTREIGVLRAIGASRWQIFQLFWLETIQVCLTGSVVGIVAAFLSARALEGWLRAQLPFAPREAFVRWELWIAAVCLGGALVLGSLAGFLPAWRAARLSPVRAMGERGGAT
jgi:putative ABC transport system permease protein